ncbi:killer toxin [Penicillium longicatenatum]|uniref:killer toxin n=1 Tax=Penicillium longicatenatum TaxID=1561947 RepID=UPI0025470CE8|nr:killer toxin [Penicillium longicatenatum]KAJ5649517.1 killer toxin [Penicillium longicatenatum]
MRFEHVLLAALTSTAEALALGINCRGSSNCGAPDAPELIDQIDPSRWYDNGEQIACQNEALDEGAVCAFLQNSGGAPASSIITLARELEDHGCGVCGSIPLFYPNDNNVDDGELTINFVSGSCCSGSTCICP